MVIFLLLCGFIISFGVTGLYRPYALANRVLDIPNRRSSHTVPTPRGGGVGLVVAYLLGIALLAVPGQLDLRVSLGLGVGGAGIALLGWWDDHTGLRPLTRLIVQCLVAGWTVVCLGGLPELRFGLVDVTLGAWGFLPAVVGLVWLTNLYNFMDGIDGLAGSEAVTAGATVAVILAAAGAPGLAMLSGLVAASAAGFLVWNWPPAKIFMGDVGSTFLGYVFGAIALAGDRATGIPTLLLLLPLAVFITDATWTLLRRLLRGEPVYEAHRSHVYQRLVRCGWSHGRVTRAAVACNLGLAIAAWFAFQRLEWLPAILAGVVLVLAVAGWAMLRFSTRPPIRPDGAIASSDSAPSRAGALHSG